MKTFDEELLGRFFGGLKTPPKQIFYEGDIDVLSRPIVCIVGSRRCGQYSKQAAFRLANALSNAGAAVVSGGALGIDASAHEGAFPHTIAVVANGLDIFYPVINRHLLQKIHSQALAISEYPHGTSATKYSFVIRNRLMAAMSQAVVIAEADANSGTMRTAEYALGLGRPIFVLPHRLGESCGTNELLRCGDARPIYDFDDFLGELGLRTESKPETTDELLLFCRNGAAYDEVFAHFGDRLFEYELDGKIRIENSKVWGMNGI